MFTVQQLENVVNALAQAGIDLETSVNVLDVLTAVSTDKVLITRAVAQWACLMLERAAHEAIVFGAERNAMMDKLLEETKG